VDRPTRYAEDVVNGRLDRAVGKSEILACKRHLRDLERAGTPEFPFVWREDKAQRIIDFAEHLILAEGTNPAPLRLWGFQAFVYGNWNGWVHKDTGFRRFRTSYEQLARQNGKSIGNAIPALYYGNFNGYQYPQVYCTATKELQAKLVLKECYKFINADAELSGTKTKKGLFTIKDYRSEIQCNITRGLIKALGRDTETIDGFRPYFGSVDEYHKHKTNQMYKLLTDGMNEMKEGLVSIITTAGFDLNCPCKEEYDYGLSVLAGFPDETHFVYICELDKDDDIWDEANWPKANPLWTPQKLTSIRASAIKAREKGGEELRNFMTKCLNMWVQVTDNSYLDMEKWAACASDTTLDDMRGRECYLGLDLSSGGDLTSGALEFPLDVDGERKYFIDSHSFLPKSRLGEHVKTDKAPYDMWVRDGLITLTETLGGMKTDYKYIIRHYKDLIAKYDLKLLGIGYDPHNADAFLSDLESFGVDCVSITQSARNLNDAVCDFELEVDAGNISYNRANTLLTWSFTNAVVVYNSFGEKKLDKDARRKRIDPCDAVIDAHKLAMLEKPAISVEEFATQEFLAKLWG
jgi:phage terminase large subunit-like protein